MTVSGANGATGVFAPNVVELEFKKGTFDANEGQQCVRQALETCKHCFQTLTLQCSNLPYPVAEELAALILG